MAKSDFKSNLQVRLVQDDIFSLEADVLTCPDGPHLNHIKGIAQAISLKAGKDDLKAFSKSSTK